MDTSKFNELDNESKAKIQGGDRNLDFINRFDFRNREEFIELIAKRLLENGNANKCCAGGEGPPPVEEPGK